MTYKEQIEATIKEYQNACKPENLNYDYCVSKSIQQGMCYYCDTNKFYKLYCYLLEENFIYLTHTPTFHKGADEFSEILLELHNIRIEYLQNLLKEIK